MKIKQHIPGFVSGVDPGEGSFDSLAELKAIPWVQSWLDGGNFTLMKSQELLMAVGPKEFWVIGYLDAPDQLDLPIWVSR